MKETAAIAPLAQEQLRQRRLFQLSGLVLLGLLASVVLRSVAGQWGLVGLLVSAMAFIAVCLAISKKGHTDLATMLILTSMTLAISAFMWFSHGLRDPVLLCFPVSLMIAGLLSPRPYFFALMLYMVLFSVGITLATDVYGLRIDQAPSHALSFMGDVLIVLMVAGLAVWFVATDLHATLRKLTYEMDAARKAQAQMTHFMQHDVLTGLPNRSYGLERTEHAMAEARQQQLQLAILFVDLDYFKSINDSLGHTAGDDFLRQASGRLKRAVRTNDLVIRQGSDEFVVVMPNVSDVRDITSVAQSILGRISRPINLNGTEIATSCSIGIAIFPDDGADIGLLLRQADIAMYQAKESGRNTYRFFDKGMQDHIQGNLQLIASMRTALTQREFVLHYQPVMDLNTGKLVGAEALIRWQHPEQGLLAPGLFIAAAEKSGLIIEMGEWVLREACRQVAHWHASGCEPFVISVNLSPIQFRRGNIDLMVQNALRVSGLAPHCLELEITESSLVQDMDKFMESLQRIKALGVKISIDDFGTGYSNLAYLQRFSVDKLKIDRSFVMRILKGPQERALVAAIIQMAKSLNLSTNAEGIEEDAIRRELLLLGCDLGQGYYFSRPQTPEEFEMLIHSKPV
jgi:diguanylate cyclase (GGDEF)-like protein